MGGERVEADGKSVEVEPWTPEEIETAIRPLSDLVLNRLNRRGTRRMLMGIAGPPGAGKSVFAARFSLWMVSEGLLGAEAVCLVPLDGHHYPNAYLDAHEELKEIKGTPQTFDVRRYAEDLQRLRKETFERVLLPAYDRTLHDVVEDAICVEPDARLVVTEGNYLLLDTPGWRRAAEALDLKVFLDAPEDRLLRNLVERNIRGGYTRDRALSHWERIDLKNAEVVRSSKGRASVTIDADVGGRLRIVDRPDRAWHPIANKGGFV